MTINVEDANDNGPVLPSFNFGKGKSSSVLHMPTKFVLFSGVNQSAAVDTVVGQVMVCLLQLTMQSLNSNNSKYLKDTILNRY